MSSALPRRSVYVAADAVCDAPEYARRLVERAAVDCFVVRAGFNPLATDGRLEQAVDQVKSLGVQCWLLVGTWWGNGLDPGEEAMVPFAEDLLKGAAPAHEGQWRMASPGGRMDDVVEETLHRLCRRFDPDGICLTHARYRHPAAISGMFETGGGAFQALMRQNDLSVLEVRDALSTVQERLNDLDAASLIDHLAERGVTRFLDSVSGADVFSRWFGVRSELVNRSLRRFSRAVKDTGTGTRFGTNAFGPTAAFECGQDYVALSLVCDFVQPLLGYVNWHVLQPVSAWSDFLHDRVPGLTRGEAKAASAAIFGLAGRPMESFESPLRLDAGEGQPAGIAPVVERQLTLLEAIDVPRNAFLPVLRGRDWPTDVTRALTGRIESYDYGGVVFQGTVALAGPSPAASWA